MTLIVQCQQWPSKILDNAMHHLHALNSTQEKPRNTEGTLKTARLILSLLLTVVMC